jgi:ribonuclease BN (tRNA processing enzyme)
VRLTVVGCSGSVPGPDSAASCYLVEALDADGRPWRVLLDLGAGALGPLQRYLDLSALDAVLLSHLHPDHCLDVCALYVALRYGPSRPGQPVLLRGPAGCAERLSRACAADDGPDAGPDLRACFQVAELVDGRREAIGPLSVLPRRVPHSGEAFALRVEHHGRVLTYTGDGDTAVGDAAVGDTAAGDTAADDTAADVLLAEASFEEGRDLVRGLHMTGRRAGELAERAGVGRLVLTHLPPWTRPAVVLAEARAATGRPVDLAAPGQRYEI